MNTYIIISTVLLIIGIISFIGFIEHDGGVIAGISAIVCCLLAIIIYLSSKDYIYNVTITAQDGQKYIYEQCYIDTSSKGNKVCVMFKGQDSIIFYDPIKIEQKRAADAN